MGLLGDIGWALFGFAVDATNRDVKTAAAAKIAELEHQEHQLPLDRYANGQDEFADRIDGSPLGGSTIKTLGVFDLEIPAGPTALEQLSASMTDKEKETMFGDGWTNIPKKIDIDNSTSPPMVKIRQVVRSPEATSFSVGAEPEKMDCLIGGKPEEIEIEPGKGPVILPPQLNAQGQLKRDKTAEEVASEITEFNPNEYVKPDAWRPHFEDFTRLLERRLISAQHSYGNRSFESTSLLKLAEEILEEIVDIAGWCLPLWVRITKVKAGVGRLSKMVAEFEAWRGEAKCEGCEHLYPAHGEVPPECEHSENIDGTQCPLTVVIRSLIPAMWPAAPEWCPKRKRPSSE